LLSVGNIKSQTAAGIKTQFLYNLDEEQTTTINAKGGPTNFVLGVMGEVRAQYDPNNVPSYFGYKSSPGPVKQEVSVVEGAMQKCKSSLALSGRRCLCVEGAMQKCKSSLDPVRPDALAKADMCLSSSAAPER
jgi:hypothetical protein